MKRHASFHAHAAIPNLAPMVDVVMVILIFFMLGTRFVLSEGFLSTRLPSRVGPGGGAKISIVPAVRISLIGESGESCGIEVMGHRLADGDFVGLGAMMKARADAGADKQARVVIQAASSVRYSDVVSTMDACARAGFSRIQFAVNQEEMEPASGVMP